MQAQLTIESGLLQDLGNIQFNPVSAIASGKLFGYVTDIRTIFPISAAIVSVKNTTTNQLLEVVSGTDGTFNFPVVPAGTYAITIKATGYTQVDFTSVISAGDEIDLGSVLMRKPGIDALIPDVAVLAIDRSALISDVASFEASGSIGVTLINRGNASVEVPFNIYAFEDLNNNGTYDATDALLGQSSPAIDSLTPLHVDGTLNASIAISGNLSFRDAPISILLDATNVLVELSEANNLSSTAGLCSNQQKPNVDLALCMDSSGSVSAAEFKLQLEGTAQAIENVVPRDGTVRISALQFASASKIELNPTIIEEDNVQSIADKIRAIRKSGGGTSIHACIDQATTLISSALPASAMQIIDVSTDGQSAQSSAVAASNRAKTAGIDVLNAIGVGTGISTSLLNAIVFPQPVGGDRGFVLTVKNYQEYMNGITGKIQRETKIADLTLGGTTLIDNGFGTNPDAKVVIGNAGATTITESILLSIFDAAPENGGQLVASQTIETDLVSGSHIEVAFTNIDTTKLSTGKMVIVAKLSGDFPECNSGNNRQEIPVASKRGDIELSLSGNKFGPNVDVLLSNIVANYGSLKGQYSVNLTIKDGAGILVHSFAANDINDLLPDQSTNLSYQWNTGLTAFGNYSATASLFDAQGNLLDSDTESFVISELDDNGQTENGDPLGRVAPFTDKPQYHIDDQVVVGYSVENITRVHTINNPTVTLVVSSPVGFVVYENTVPYSSLLPGQLLQWQQSFGLTQASEGTYQVIATLKDSNDVVYGSGVSNFVVENNPELALRGNVTAAFADIDSGDEQECDFTTINSGSAPLENQHIRYSVVNVDDQQIKSEETSLLNLDVQQQLPRNKKFLTSGFSAGTYACVLEVLRNGELSALAAVQFSVKESAIKLTGDLALGEKARLLVLIDSSTTERTYLENLLTTAGWFYTIVDNAAAFKTELTQGGYGVYALLSEKVTLDQATQNLLNTKVAAGDGLVVAGATDRRHQTLEQALGIKARANEAYAKGVGVQESALGYAWERTFDKSSRVLNFTANGATVIGEYRNNLPGADTQTVLGALGAAGRYGNLVLDNHTSLSSTVEGRLAVGGNLSLQNFSVGDKLDPNKLHDVVTVGGNVTFPSGRIYYGNLIAGGSVSGVGDPVRFGMAQGAVIRGNSALDINFTGEREYLQELSAKLATLPANGTVKMQWGGMELKGDCTSTSQVFNVKSADLGVAHTFAVSCIPAGATVVFNVSGTSVTIKNMGMQSLTALRDRVLFNFPQATSLKMTSVGIEGSILAPFAQVDQPAGRIDGQVIVKSWYSTTSGYMSIHNRFFGGDLSAAVSPASKNALATYQYQQGKSVFAGFDVLAQATALGASSENPFAQLLLSVIEQVNPAPLTARAGKVVPVIVTYENTSAQTATGQVKLALTGNIMLLNSAAFTQVANSNDWVLPLNLNAGASNSQTIYVQLPASGASSITQQLQTGTSPDWETRFEKALNFNLQ
jgi:choice-of-anchor A domain-containing protein